MKRHLKLIAICLAVAAIVTVLSIHALAGTTAKPTVASSTESSITVNFGEFTGICITLNSSAQPVDGTIWVEKNDNGTSYPLSAASFGQTVCSYSSNSTTVTFSGLAPARYYIFGKTSTNAVSAVTVWATTPKISASDVAVTSTTASLPYLSHYQYSLDGVTFVSPTLTAQPLPSTAGKNIIIKLSGTSTPTAVISGLEKGTEYKIYVRASGSSGEAASAVRTVTVTTARQPSEPRTYSALFSTLTFYYTLQTSYRINGSSWTPTFLVYPTEGKPITLTAGGKTYTCYFDDPNDPQYITFGGLSENTTYNFGIKYYGDGDDSAASFTKSTLKCLHNFKTTLDPETHMVTYVCTTCGYTYTAEEHVHTWEKEEEIPVTCFEDGYITWKCSDCGEEKVETIKATGHHWIGVIKESTCVEHGYFKLICSICGEEDESKYEEYPLGGHVPGEEEITEPTCTESGYKRVYCTACGELLSEEEIPATGHTPGEEEITPPTCTEPGHRTVRCVDCGEIISDEEIPATGHTPGEEELTPPTCTESGHRTVYCSVCGEIIVDEDLPPLGHIHTEEEITQPTCTKPGHKTVRCADCGEIVSEEEIPATGHDWKTVTVPSTCVEHGHTEEICSACGEKKPGTFVELPLEEHKLEWVTVTEPTETTDGLRKQICSVCHGEFGSEIIEKLIELAFDKEKLTYELKEDGDSAPVGYVANVSEDDDATVKIIFKNGVTVELDGSALKAFRDEKATITVYRVRNVNAASGDITKAGYDVDNYAVYEITAENADFKNSGKAEITVDHVLEDGYVAKVYYVDAAGHKSFVESSYADGKLTFKTNHFSTYVVVNEEYDAEAAVRAAIIISCVVALGTAVVVGYLLYTTRISRKDRFRL